MHKNLIFLMVVLMGCLPVQTVGQVTGSRYIDFFGRNIAPTFNYEIKFGDKPGGLGVAAGFGFSMYPQGDTLPGSGIDMRGPFVVFPVSLVLSLGRNGNYLDLMGGISFGAPMRIALAFSDADLSDIGNRWDVHGFIGYKRHRMDEPSWFRMGLGWQAYGFTSLADLNNSNAPGRFFILPSIAFGRAF